MPESNLEPYWDRVIESCARKLVKKGLKIKGLRGQGVSELLLMYPLKYIEKMLLYAKSVGMKEIDERTVAALIELDQNVSDIFWRAIRDFELGLKTQILHLGELKRWPRVRFNNVQTKTRCKNVKNAKQSRENGSGENEVETRLPWQLMNWKKETTETNYAEAKKSYKRVKSSAKKCRTAKRKTLGLRSWVERMSLGDTLDLFNLLSDRDKRFILVSWNDNSKSQRKIIRTFSYLRVVRNHIAHLNPALARERKSSDVIYSPQKALKALETCAPGSLMQESLVSMIDRFEEEHLSAWEIWTWKGEYRKKYASVHLSPPPRVIKRIARRTIEMFPLKDEEVRLWKEGLELNSHRDWKQYWRYEKSF